MKYLPRIEHIWMLLALGEHGEGLIVDPEKGLPAIAASDERLADLVQLAPRAAAEMRKIVRLVKFTSRVDEQEFTPPQPAWQSDAITVPPTMTGSHGRAWRIELAVLQSDQQRAGVDAWLIEAPDAHPLWHSYALLCVHLRPIQDAPPPTFHLADATHEVMLFALDPNQQRQVMIERATVTHWLQPANFVAQFIEVTDDLARERIERTARMVVDGELNPDTDFRNHWIKLFGGNCYRDA